MIKKFISMLMVAAILCSLLIGCDNDTDPNETNQGTSSQGTTLPDDGTEAPTIDVNDLTYPQFNALSPEDKQSVMESFDSVEEFTQWRDELKEFHEEFNDKLQGTQAGTEPTTANTEPNVNTTEPTVGNTEPDIEDPTNDTTAPGETEPEPDKVTFLDYQAMSATEQKRFINSFPSIDAFMQWHSEAVQEYKDGMKEWGSDNTPTNPTFETEG